MHLRIIILHEPHLKKIVSSSSELLHLLAEQSRHTMDINQLDWPSISGQKNGS
jgi:hypothetical protein